MFSNRCNITQLLRGTVLGLTALLCACGPAMKQWEPDKKVKVYTVSSRQTLPQPPYNRLRWVNFPEPLPEKSATTTTESVTVIKPVFHLDLKNTPLDEAALVLASTSRYTSSCPGSECSSTVTLTALGTIDELARELSRKTGVLFSVDHVRREVRVGGTSRVVREGAITPGFYSDARAGDGS
jgi:hypothetical protein